MMYENEHDLKSEKSMLRVGVGELAYILYTIITLLRHHVLLLLTMLLVTFPVCWSAIAKLRFSS